jgi:3-deoxy-manno-octulosonate cytidylyltransferase (CMP-KDO synthetase)
MLRFAIIIPARLASSRLPAKPLLRQTGKFLIQHVYELAVASQVAETVLVATDDEQIVRAVDSFGGQAVMTRIDHQSGTDRIAEVAETLDVDAVLNLQGDEPQFDPNALKQLAQLLESDPACGVATLATPIHSKEIYFSPNAVKVVCDDHGRALYFSRSPIPMVRDGEPDFTQHPLRFLLHLGVYAYRRTALLNLAKTSPHPLEQLEKLEQLRVLAMGDRILVGVIPRAHRGVDTPEDYAAFVKQFQGDLS